jgi:hypothetical protein
MEINKNIKLFLNWVVGPILFAWIAWRISIDLREQTDTITNPSFWIGQFKIHPLALACIQFVLMGLQWSIEAFKWKTLLSSSLKLPFRSAFTAVFRGIAVSVVTPNRVGEFVGRVLHLPKEHVVQGVGWTFICNLAQLVVTLFMGTVAVFLLEDELNSIFKYTEWNGFIDLAAIISLSALLVAVLAYWGAPWVIQQIAKRSPLLSNRLHVLEETPKNQLIVILGLSFLRFSIFVFQYWVFFWALDISIEYMDLLLKLSVLFLWLAVIPTFTVLELGLRWQFALLLFSAWQEVHLSILLIVTAIWCINFILPAMLGAIDLIRYRPFKIKT